MKSALPFVLSSMVAAFCGLASGPLPQKTAGAPSAKMVDKAVAQSARTTNRDAATDGKVRRDGSRRVDSRREGRAELIGQ
jgi:hypothetical protein